MAEATVGSCSVGEEIWAHDSQDGLRSVVYYPGSPSPNAVLVFEGWRENGIIWRVRAEQACSKGVAFCSAIIPLKDNRNIVAPIEVIHESHGALYIVFSHLRQSTFQKQNYEENTAIDAKWFTPAPRRQVDTLIVLPSVYRLIGCQKGNELSVGNDR